MSKFQFLVFSIGLLGGVYGGAYLFRPDTKIVYKDKIVEKIVTEENLDRVADVEQKMDKMIEFIDNPSKQLFARIALQHFNLNIDTPDLETAYQNAKALAVIMYQECGVCDRTERIFVGFSAFYNAVNYYNSDLVLTKNSQESSRACKYTYSFMCTPSKREYIPDEKLEEYMIDSVNIIYAPNEELKGLREYYIVKNGQNKVHFCNVAVESGDCTWHKQAIAKAGGQAYRLVLGDNKDPYSVAVGSLSQHTFYPILKAQKGE